MNLMKIWSLMILVLGGVVNAAPLPPVATDGTNTLSKLTLQTVWRQTLDAPLMDAVFEEVEMTVKEAKTKGWMNVARQAETTKVKVPRIRVGMVQRDPDEHKEDEEVRFYDANGRLIKTIQTSLERVVRSPKGNYIVILSWGDDEQVGGGTLLDREGREIWRKEEGIVPIRVSDEGVVLAMQPPGEGGGAWGDGVVYQRNGTGRTNIVNPFSTVLNQAQAEFTKEGAHIFFGFSKWPDETKILNLTTGGQVVWEKTLPFMAFTGVMRIPDQVRTSAAHGVVAIGERKRQGLHPEIFVFRLSKDGQLMWEKVINQGGTLNLDYDPASQRICVISSAGGVIFFLDATTGEILHEYQEPWSHRGYPIQSVVERPWPSQVKLLGNHAYIIGEYQRNRRKGWYASALYVFDAQNGTLISKNEYPEARLLLREVGGQPVLLNFDTREARMLRMGSESIQK